jgi:predicted dehydrogenase
LDVYLNHLSVESCVVYDFDSAKAVQAAAVSERISVAQNAEDVLNDPSINIVSVASYDNHHAAQVIRALSLGKHVFVEKPLCLSMQEAILIQQALKQSPNARVSSNLPLRACPRFRLLKEAILNGNMGSIYAMRADYFWGRVEKLTAGWRADMPFYSIIYGASVHMIDLAIWMLGRRPVEVRALGNQMATTNSALRYNDFVTLQMIFEDGLVVESSAHGGCVHPHFHRVEVYGTQKSFLQELSGASWVNSSDEKIPLEAVVGGYPAKETRAEILKSFLDLIVGNVDRGIVTQEDVFSTMSVCFAAQESMQTGRSIKIEYL